jgi:hypothetical protein
MGQIWLKGETLLEFVALNLLSKLSVSGLEYRSGFNNQLIVHSNEQ